VNGCRECCCCGWLRPMHRGAACGRHIDEHGLKSHPVSVVHLSALLVVGTVALLAFLGRPGCVPVCVVPY
jgi:hypothetical protein